MEALPDVCVLENFFNRQWLLKTVESICGISFVVKIFLKIGHFRFK